MSRGMRALIAICSAGLVLLLVLLDLEDVGPGRLAATHAQVEVLHGQDGCVLCHGNGPEELASRCLDCHQQVTAQREQARGIHGSLPEAQRDACGSCHPEHLGKEGALLTERAFTLSGHPGPQGFGHGSVPFDLHGRHEALDCKDCHPLAEVAVLPEGESRFLGQVQDCTACHDDPHEGAMLRSCEECHGQMHAFDDLSHFPHDARFPLHASHSGLDCAACHEDQGPHAVAALSDPQAEIPWRSCSDCHESPHRESFLASLPLPASGLPEGGQCAVCHSEQHAAFRDPAVELSPAQHAASGFSLEAPHAQLACAACHPEGSDTSFAERFPGRAAAQCASCHDDPHAGQFDRPPYQERGCLSCHAEDQFHPHGFDLDAHARTAFALTGSHESLDCALCHAEEAGVRQFAGTPLQCEACHADAHDGALVQGWSAHGAPPPAGSCALCHDTTRFASIHSEFDHAAWTGFALEGAHDPLDCEACHTRAAQPDERGRRFGRVADLHPGNPASCAPCHEDAHGGRFDAPGLPTTVGGRLGCARCHEQDAFHAVDVQRFDHGLWTAFALDGAHAQTECVLCHGQGESTRLGKVHEQFDGDLAQCASCHADPHAGAFEDPGLPQQVEGRSGCARCHDERSFRLAGPSFEHGKWTGFALEGAHARTACTACHPSLHPPSATGRRSQRAAGRDCADCHADVHLGQFARGGSTNCASCHSSEATSFAIPRFDHDAQTRFALDDTHAKLDCSACHRTETARDGRSAVRYKPLGIECGDCHAAGGGR